MQKPPTITPCARASLPPSNANGSSDAAVPLRSRHAWPTSASSKASTIPPGGTPPWGIARPVATNSRCKQTDSPLPPEPSTKTGQLQSCPNSAPRQCARGSKKNALKPHLRRIWCVPHQHSAEFVFHIEDVLEVHHRRHDPQRPVVCLDECSKQLI